jgi:cleavage and polyadenylation specificity factor subunit 2
LIQDLYASTPLAATKVSSTSLAEISYAYSQSASSDTSFLLQAPTPEEIARYFSLIQPLKYSQPHQPLPSPFSPPLNGLTITAYNSGHTLGGTIWHIQHGLESIVYAVDWNQARENVFSGAAWLSGGHGSTGGTEVIEQLRKPTALVCSSRTPETTLARTRRDEQLLESIKLCLARGGTVLIPIDSSARVLELAYLLEHAWRTEAANGTEPFKSSKLYLAGRNVNSTMRLARSMLEWMDDSIIREFEASAEGGKRANGTGGGGGGKGVGPFDFKYLRLLDRKAQIERILTEDPDSLTQTGKVILASDSSLDWGFSKEILKTIADDARNLVVLTEKPSKGTDSRYSIARTLWDWYKERKHGVATEQTTSGDTFEQVYVNQRELEFSEPQRQPLEGKELDVYQQWLVTQRQLQATLQSGGATVLETSGDGVDDASSESSEDTDDEENEQQGKALNVSTTMGQASRKKVVLKDEDLGVMILLKRKGVYDFDVRGKKGRERMFPVPIRRRRQDEYGELIRPEDYLRAEEREDADAQDGPQSGKGEDGDKVGKKRKWDDVGTTQKGGSGPNKRPQMARAMSADELDMKALSDGHAADELDNLEDDSDPVAVGPSKLAISTTTVTVNLRIAFVDFSGLHDKRSLNMLIPLIQPRKLILVAGSEDETLSLAADCKKLLAAQLGTDQESAIDVFTPKVGVSIDASVDTNAWVVKLADPLVKRLKWQKVRGLGIVTVTGLLVGGQFTPINEDHAAGDEEGANKRQKTITDGSAAPPESITSGQLITTREVPMPTLDMLPINLVSAVRSAAQPLHVGDLRLADLRRAMQSSGHTAEFRGEGTLLIDGSVVVRKTSTGRIEVESIGLPVAGGPSTFSAVKKQIYEGLAVVTGA